jgi:hypothetical protein
MELMQFGAMHPNVAVLAECLVECFGATQTNCARGTSDTQRRAVCSDCI